MRLLAAVLITHLHSDHVCALNDVITTHWVMSQENATLKIYGPVGTEQFVERQMHALEPDIGYRVEHHDFLTHGPRLEVTDLEPGDAFTVGDVQITTAATEHSPVKPTIGFRLEHDGAVVALAGDTLPCDGVDELARDALAAAYASGLFASIPDGTPVRWLVPDRGCCSAECHDNSLADGVMIGDPFPTGDLMAPAGPGCRSLVIPNGR